VKFSSTFVVQGRQGRIYSKQGPVRKKMWGPVTWGSRPYFSWKKTGNVFLVITVRVSAVSSAEKLATFFGHPCHFYSFHSFTRVSPIITGACKKCRSFCGPILWGPCSAEHAEHA